MIATFNPPPVEVFSVYIDEMRHFDKASGYSGMSHPLPADKKPGERDPMNAAERERRNKENRRARRARARNRK